MVYGSLALELIAFMSISGPSGPIYPEKLNLDHVMIDPSVALKVPTTLAIRKQIIPLSTNNGKIFAACIQADMQAVNLIQRYFESPIELKIADEPSLQRALDRVYGGLQKNIVRNDSTKTMLSEEESERAVELGEELIYSGVLRSASDIHLVPYENQFQVLFRLYGELEEYGSFPKSLHSSVVSRFKVLGGLDIAEKRAPQDGAFRHTIGSKSLDIRVATIPTQYGERVTLRLLGVQTEALTLEQLGMSETHLSQLQRLLEKPHGLILLTGPTGSGKTTTLYAAIREILKKRRLNIITVEDPVEYKIPGISQVRVDAGDKVSFSKALRSILRHDPDVVVIGEIRDQETIEVAIKASLTGHLVLSTLHTNSAAGVITRLEDMGVPRYLISATLKAILAQRLVRKCCSYCLTSESLSSLQQEAFHATEISKTFRPQGCLYCAYRGYTGRLGLFELLLLDEFWSQKILEGAKEQELIQQMRNKQIPLLLEDGLFKITQGWTTCDEVLFATAL